MFWEIISISYLEFNFRFLDITRHKIFKKSGAHQKFAPPSPVLKGLKLVNELDKPVVPQYRDNLLQQCRDYATAEMRVYLHAILLRTS